MKYFGQNQEDKYILDYFKYPGNILDIGANDGKTLSNSYLPIMTHGWTACLVEPSPHAFIKLYNEYSKLSYVYLFNYAISDKDGTLDFYESGSHLNNGDVSLLSTLKESELNRWTKEEFTKIKVQTKTFKQFLIDSPLKTFDCISIDAEGVDYEILIQMDLQLLRCHMLIIEYNGIDENKYIEYCNRFNMKLHHKNNENLIFVR